MSKQKHIFILIGPKGSGKSFIGSLFDKYFGIAFVRVEDWARAVQRDRMIDDEAYIQEIFAVIEKGIREKLNQTDQVVFESTGLTTYFDEMLNSLATDYPLTTIKIQADPISCLQRVRSRDQSIHIDVSDSQVHQINAAVMLKNIETDHVIQNVDKDEMELKAEIGAIIDTIG